MEILKHERVKTEDIWGVGWGGVVTEGKRAPNCEASTKQMIRTRVKANSEDVWERSQKLMSSLVTCHTDKPAPLHFTSLRFTESVL